MIKHHIWPLSLNLMAETKTPGACTQFWFFAIPFPVRCRRHVLVISIFCPRAEKALTEKENDQVGEWEGGSKGLQQLNQIGDSSLRQKLCWEARLVRGGVSRRIPAAEPISGRQALVRAVSLAADASSSLLYKRPGEASPSLKSLSVKLEGEGVLGESMQSAMFLALQHNCSPMEKSASHGQSREEKKGKMKKTL